MKQFPDRDWQKKQEAYGKIANDLAGRGQCERAVQIVEVVEKEKKLPWGALRTKRELAMAMARAGKIQEALQLIKQSSKIASHEVLQTIAWAQLAAGQKQQAQKTLQRAEKTGSKGSQMFAQKYQTLQKVARAYAAAGQQEQALAKLKQAVEAAHLYKKSKYSTRSKEYVIAGRLLDMLPTAIKVGDAKQTNELLKRGVELSQKASLLLIAAQKLVQAGLYKQALETAEKIDNSRRKRAAMRLMAKALTMLPAHSYRQIFNAGRVNYAPLKAAFTPAEQAFAKQLVKGLQ